MSCASSAQEFSNGFCFDKCKSGYQGQGPLCLIDCPKGFNDHGTTCEPQSILRKPVKAYLTPCASNQIDRNGDCFEPQTVAWYNKVSGCGCIRTKLSERLQCPSGYSIYNNSCITNCPSGYNDVLDDAGNISSLYCNSACPITNGVAWTNLNGLCLKQFYTRLQHIIVNTQTSPVFSSPQSMVKYLASAPLGSSINERYRKNYTIFQDLNSGQSNPPLGANGVGPLTSGWNPFVPSSDPFSSWLSIFSDPKTLLFFVAAFGLIAFGGPSLFSGIGKAFGSLFAGLGQLAGSVEKGAGALVESTAGAVAGLEASLSKDVNAAIAVPGARLAAKNAAAPILAQERATMELTGAQEALNRSRAS